MKKTPAAATAIPTDRKASVNLYIAEVYAVNTAGCLIENESKLLSAIIKLLGTIAAIPAIRLEMPSQ